MRKEFAKPQPASFYMMVTDNEVAYHDLYTDYTTTKQYAAVIADYLKYRGCQRVYYNGVNYNNVARITYIPAHCNPQDIEEKINEFANCFAATIKIFSTMQEVRDYVEANPSVTD